MLLVLAPETGYTREPPTAMLELIHVEHLFDVHVPLVRTRGLDTSTRGTSTIESPLKRKGPVPRASLSRVVGRTVSTINHSSHILATNQVQPQPQCSKLKCGQWSTVRWSMHHYRLYTHGRFPRYHSACCNQCRTHFHHLVSGSLYSRLGLQRPLVR